MWKKVSGGGGNFLKFKVGESFIGIYLGYTERPNPFYDKENTNSTENIIDYKIQINGEEKILSSTAQTLRDQLIPLSPETQVKIDCVQKGIKKWFVVWVAD